MHLVFRVNLALLFTSYSGYIRLHSLQADSAIVGPGKVDGVTLKVMVHKAAHLPCMEKERLHFWH